MEFILLLIGLGCGGLFTYLVLRKKLKTTQHYDSMTAMQNVALLEEQQRISEKLESLKIAENEYDAQLKDKETQLQHLVEIINNKKEIQNTQLELLQEQMSAAADRLGKEFQESRDQYEKEFLQAQQETINGYKEQIQVWNNLLGVTKSELEKYRKLVECAVLENKRAEEKKEKENFYRLNLAVEDLEEISKLREVSKYLRDKEPLNKVIWKVYYENPYTDLVGRVLGKQVHTGIYKITNLTNGMCYVGQAVNVADRWKQHIKRGMGAEAPTRNKLYPAMLAIGVENFSFELIEDCTKEELNEKEQYWQDFFKAKEFGYSIK